MRQRVQNLIISCICADRRTFAKAILCRIEGPEDKANLGAKLSHVSCQIADVVALHGKIAIPLVLKATPRFNAAYIAAQECLRWPPGTPDGERTVCQSCIWRARKHPAMHRR